MKHEDRAGVAALLDEFFHIAGIAEHAAGLGSGNAATIAGAIDLFERHPEVGFIWVQRDEGGVVGIATVCIAISTHSGSLVAKLIDFVVAQRARGLGIGQSMMESLVDELRRRQVKRIDLGVHGTNEGAIRFYERFGFAHNHEIGMSLVL